MSKFLPYKKKLIINVLEKEKKNTVETSFSGILKDLETTLQDDFRIQLSYRSFETYYKTFVKKEEDYNIKSVILNDLSVYLGFENFADYCKRNAFEKDSSNVKINIDENEESMKIPNFSDIIINITNSPIFNFPEFVTKHKNGFGIVGILLAAGIFFNKTDYFSSKENQISQQLSIMSGSTNTENFKEESQNKEEKASEKEISIPEQDNAGKISEIAEIERRKECMYWNNLEYIPVFCDQNIANFKVVQRNEDFLKVKKITRPDTLTIENAIGKVWYDKSNKNVEFFTHHGIHPENGKTLRNATKTNIEKYAK